MTRQDDLDQGIEQMMAEGQGFWRLTMVPQQAADTLLLRAMSGDRQAGYAMQAISQAVTKIQRSTRARRMVCLLCPAQFTRRSLPGAFILLHASVDRPTQMITNGVCVACCNQHGPDGLRAAAVAAHRDQTFPDLREITTGQEGHA